jgi:hypothetical protein
MAYLEEVSYLSSRNTKHKHKPVCCFKVILQIVVVMLKVLFPTCGAPCCSDKGPT